MDHKTAPCATRGVPVRYTKSKVTLIIPCFGVNTVSQYAAWIAQSVLVHTQETLGLMLDPAVNDDDDDDDDTPASGR